MAIYFHSYQHSLSNSRQSKGLGCTVEEASNLMFPDLYLPSTCFTCHTYWLTSFFCFVRLPQQCCWRFKFHGMLHYVVWSVVTSTSKDCKSPWRELPDAECEGSAFCWNVSNCFSICMVQLNVFERKVYRRILGPVYDNEKENWRILTNKEIYASVKRLTVIETNKVK